MAYDIRPIPVCMMVETSSVERSLIYIKQPRMSPLGVWYCEPWFSAQNPGGLEILRDCDPRMVGVRFNWFAAPELPEENSILNVILASKHIRQLGYAKSRHRLTFTDQENPAVPFSLMRRHLSPMFEVSNRLMNWQNCVSGPSYWGDYTGAVFTSCPECLISTNPVRFDWLMETIKQCVPFGDCVPWLPCKWQDDDSPGTFVIEYGTARMYSYMTNIIIGAVKRGVRTFGFSDYQIPPEYTADYITCFNDAMAFSEKYTK